MDKVIFVLVWYKEFSHEYMREYFISLRALGDRWEDLKLSFGDKFFETDPAIETVRVHTQETWPGE